MQHILMILILGSLSTFSFVAFGDFNMRDAAFLKTMNDFAHPALARTYSSRSLWRGETGFGWCSGFEKRIRLLGNGKALMIHCESENDIQVQRQGSQWIYQGRNGREIFDSNGRLLQIDRPKVTFTYLKNGSLETIRTAQEVLTVFYNTRRQIREIRSSNGKSVRYEYENDNLVTASTSQAKTFLSYDAFHNLTEIQSSLVWEKISYKLETDEILAYRNMKSPCVVNFRFQKISKLELLSTIARICPGQKRQSQSFDFLFSQNNLGKLQISKMKISGDLHDKTNLP